MSTNRFEITPVPELNSNNSSSQITEIIPLVHIENEIPQPPPLPASIATINDKNINRTSSKLFNTILHKKSLDTRRRATISAAMASIGNELKKSSSVDIIHNINSINENDIDEHDTYSTIQSNNTDTNPIRTTNKFLAELRLKRRELFDKAKNISIDQRIAFNRRQNQRTIRRAQDIFDVHFESENEENIVSTTEFYLFTEESQEKIRNDIYHELDRQRTKQYHKHHQHLLLGRSLLVFMTLLLTLMSLTLIYVVIDLYDRANFLDKLPENEFIPMTNDKTANLY